MDEWQNKNGTWSEAKPIRASWETNILLQLFKKIKRRILKWMKKRKL